jgi:DNA-binding NtrC family response regulator
MMTTPFRKEFLWFFQDQIQASKACEVAETRPVVERERPDSVRSDIRMPEKSGVEGLWIVRELSKDLPSMITSVDSTDTVWAWRSGTSDYLEGSCGYDRLRTTDNRIGMPKAQLADFIKNNPLSRPNRRPRGHDPFSADWTAYHHLSEPQLFSQEGLGQPSS